MKKIILIVIIGVLVLSSIGAMAISKADVNRVEKTILLSEPVFDDVGEYINVNFEGGITSILMSPGKPMLPTATIISTFEPGTKIENIRVSYDVKEYVLSKKIQPAPEPVPLSNNLQLTKQIEKVKADENIYYSSELYPSEPYTISRGIGRNGDEGIALFVTIKVTPQYSPENDLLIAPVGPISVEIEYHPPEAPLFTSDAYDLLIITDSKFTSNLQPLVDHKEAMGVRTIMETVDNIYANYDGRDEPEDIKLFIKDAIEDWGIKYVLLAGGRKGQTFDWYIPERLSRNDDASGYEKGYSSDLYYADIYKLDEENNTVFEDWDSNGNGVFAEWRGFTKDIMDYYPDVYVGRIPCRYSFQIDVIIDKIITYETSADDSWFKKALVISGDTSPPARGDVVLGIYEGEISTGITADLLEGIGFTVDKLWTSIETFTGPQDVINGLNAGAGLVHFAGHGNPAYWGNFLPDAETEEGMVDGLTLKDMRKLRNGDELPIIVVGGCHNAQFNTTMMKIPSDIREYGFLSYFGLWLNQTKNSYRFYYKEWVPACWGSWLLMKTGGGSIGTIGNSGLGWGYINEHAAAGLGGWINPRFFDCYVNQSIDDVLGDIHSQAITDYINIVQGVNSETHDRKTIEEWVLLGDPSLKIGGYAE